jgi:hypothetical protein
MDTCSMGGRKQERTDLLGGSARNIELHPTAKVTAHAFNGLPEGSRWVTLR